MFKMYTNCRAVTPHRMRKLVSLKGGRLLDLLQNEGEEGAALVEFALMFPILMIVILGMFNLGVMLNQYLELTNAVGVAGQVLAVDRQNTLDPCADAITAVENAAPLLKPASLSFSFSLNGTAFGSYAGNVVPSACASTSTTSGAAGDLVQGKPISLTVTYPCTLGVWGTTNLLPGCQLSAQITEISQ